MAHEGSRWIGRVLRNRWRIDARIARGGVGTVWAATHKNNGSRVAIKVLHPEFSRDADTRGRFLQEGYAANKVNHPGVVRILDDDVTEEGQAFLVMELLEGELLEDRRVRVGGVLSPPEIFDLGVQLLDVLAAAHSHGIVHRDIKPENLFLTEGGRLKVLDFGFAQMKGGFRNENTATGFLLGTPGFMSPEQAIGDRAQVDAKTDIWAAGATLYTLASGRPVHEGESAAELLVAAANYPARPLRVVAPTVSPALAHIIDKALAFDKAARWSDAKEMANALRAAMAAPSATGAEFERTVVMPRGSGAPPRYGTPNLAFSSAPGTAFGASGTLAPPPPAQPMSGPGPARPEAQARPRNNRLFVTIGVAFFAMFVAILTGLLLLALADGDPSRR